MLHVRLWMSVRLWLASVALRAGLALVLVLFEPQSHVAVYACLSLLVIFQFLVLTRILHTGEAGWRLLTAPVGAAAMGVATGMPLLWFDTRNAVNPCDTHFRQVFPFILWDALIWILMAWAAVLLLRWRRGPRPDGKG